MAVSVQENVVGFDVPMYDALAVDIPEGTAEF